MSYTVVRRTPLDVSQDAASGLAPLPFAEGLFKTTRTLSRLTSPALQPPHEFDRLVGSWNAKIPADGELALSARVQSAGTSGAWSPWFELGRQNGARFFSPAAQGDSFGFVDKDTLTLKHPAAAFEYRVILKQPAAKPAILSLIAISVSNGKTSPARPFAPGPWIREIPVAPRSQMTVQSRYSRDLCSPTSLSMALSRWGRVLPTLMVASRVQDQTSEIFGDWTFNTAFAGSRGLLSYFSYLESLRALQDEIAAGRPVAASISFAQGQLSGAPIKKTNGHFVLVVGFTRQGDVIVMDPAAPRASLARRIYKRQEFRRAWLVNKRGASYLLGPLTGRAFSIGVAAANLASKPGLASIAGRHNPLRLSQILYGETVLIKAARGNWALVAAEEEPRFTNRRWGGYEGWIDANDLYFSQALRPNRVVGVKTARATLGKKTMTFSLGTRLDAIGQSGDQTRIRLTNLESAKIPSDSLLSLSPTTNAAKRARVLRAARDFLGFRYVWGGRSGAQPKPDWGVDCSGLASLSYRAAGMTIPRDAADQKRRARAVDAKSLKPGDLIFLSGSNGSLRVTHVMIYAGNGSFIESRRQAGGTLGTFQERFGQPLSDIKSGQFVLDRALTPPKPRRVYFGSYF